MNAMMFRKMMTARHICFSMQLQCSLRNYSDLEKLKMKRNKEKYHCLCHLLCKQKTFHSFFPFFFCCCCCCWRYMRFWYGSEDGGRIIVKHSSCHITTNQIKRLFELRMFIFGMYCEFEFFIIYFLRDFHTHDILTPSLDMKHISDNLNWKGFLTQILSRCHRGSNLKLLIYKSKSFTINLYPVSQNILCLCQATS